MFENIRNSKLSHDLHAVSEAGGVWPWLFAFIGAVFLTLVIKATLRIAEPRLRLITHKTKRSIDETIVNCIVGVRSWFLFFWIFVPLLHTMSADKKVLSVGNGILVIATSLQLAIWGLYAIGRWKENYLKKKTDNNATTASALGLITAVLQGTLIAALTLICLSNLGVDIGALVAGLGVGGIAVALAAQNILGDMFASLSIVLDKPFVVGDFITVGQEMGTVENIGIKTTRVRSLSGEELVFSNRDLLESRIQNFKRMWKRRVVVRFGVPYTTSSEHLRQIPTWIHEIVGKNNQIALDRCHLSDLGVSSAEYEFVYWVQSPDFNLHMDFKQAILWELHEKLRSQNIRLALPGQSLYIETLPETGSEISPAARKFTSRPLDH